MKLKIKAIYDNGGETIDRYTVYYNSSWADQRGKKLWDCVSMNDSPFHPQGFGQHGSGLLGKHNGKRIKFKDLPKDCQKLVLNDLK